MPRWFDVHSPYNGRSVGQIEVVDGKIVRTSPAYRWALSCYLVSEQFKWERKGFQLVERFTCNCKSFDRPVKCKPPAPSDSALYQRVSP